MDKKNEEREQDLIYHESEGQHSGRRLLGRGEEEPALPAGSGWVGFPQQKIFRGPSGDTCLVGEGLWFGWALVREELEEGGPAAPATPSPRGRGEGEGMALPVPVLASSSALGLQPACCGG